MKINFLNSNYFLIASILLFTSCGDDEPQPLDELSSVLVVNEGNFSAGNGSISSFDLNTEDVAQGVLEINATTQNVVEFGDNYYIVSNAPDKVDVIVSDDLSSSASITSGFQNPIDFAAIGNTGYVTNWGVWNNEIFAFEGSFISVIDLSTNTVTDSIELQVKPQGIIALNDLLYVANEGGSSVSVIDPTDFSITDIATPFGPSNFVVDADGDIWALCTSGNLIEINPATNTIKQTLEDLTTGGFNEKLAINGEGDVIYFLGGNNETFTGRTDVFKVSISESLTTVTSFVADGFAFYGIAVNPDNGDVYIGDSNAFQSTGTGFRYDSEGNELSSFATGIGPNNFIFR